MGNLHTDILRAPAIKSAYQEVYLPLGPAKPILVRHCSRSFAKRGMFVEAQPDRVPAAIAVTTDVGGSFATEDFTSRDVVITSQSISLTGAISGAQIRAARILLGWSQAQLSLQCGVSESSIVRVEAGSLLSRGSTRVKIASALTGAGIDFIESVGVRLWPHSQTKR